MSEIENTEETEPSDKEINFAAIRAKLEAAEARIAELSPLAVEKAVRAAGFDPDSPTGKALFKIATKDPDADVKALAEELGFEAGTARPGLTTTEQAAVAGAQSIANLQSVTTSDGPPNTDQAIAEAEAAGDFGLSGRLKLQSFLNANG